MKALSRLRTLEARKKRAFPFHAFAIGNWTWADNVRFLDAIQEGVILLYSGGHGGRGPRSQAALIRAFTAGKADGHGTSILAHEVAYLWLRGASFDWTSDGNVSVARMARMARMVKMVKGNATVNVVQALQFAFSG